MIIILIVMMQLMSSVATKIECISVLARRQENRQKKKEKEGIEGGGTVEPGVIAHTCPQRF